MGSLSQIRFARRGDPNPDPEVGAHSSTTPSRGVKARLASGIFFGLIAGITGLLAGCPAVQAPPPAAKGPLHVRDLAAHPLRDITPVRGEFSPLGLHRDGEVYPCSTCHEGFTGDLGQQALEDEHKNLVFDHGMNQSCMNCHNAKNSDTYVNHDGSEIPGDQPTQLCGKCHGPQYREWMQGVHGRINGHWDAKFGDQEKVQCIQCHDPHKPAYAPLKPASPPRLTRFQELPKGEHEDVK